MGIIFCHDGVGQGFVHCFIALHKLLQGLNLWFQVILCQFLLLSIFFQNPYLKFKNIISSILKLIVVQIHVWPPPPKKSKESPWWQFTSSDNVLIKGINKMVHHQRLICFKYEYKSPSYMVYLKAKTNWDFPFLRCFVYTW